MEENIYIYFGVSPDDGEAKLKAELNKKKATMQRSPKADAPQQLAIIKEYEAKLSQDGYLKAQAAAYAEARRQQRNEQEKNIRNQARILVINGEIEETALNSLSAENKAFTKEEILRIIGATIKKKKQFKYKPTGKQGKLMESSKYKSIVSQLQSVGKRDLYSFLGVSVAETCEKIKNIAQNKYTESLGHLDNDYKTTLKNLFQTCRDLLGDADKRASYDYTLSNEGFAAVEEDISRIAAGESKVILPEQYEALLEKCTKNGIHRDKAEYMIYESAEKKHITIIEPSGGKASVVCRYCGALNDEGSFVCKSCAMPLVVTCPQCGRMSTDSDEMRCTQCGFDIGSMNMAEAQVKEAENSLRINNIEEAIKHAKSANYYWPNYMRLPNLLERINAAYDSISKKIAVVKELCSKRLYYEAKSMLPSLGYGREASAIRSEVERATSSADSLLQKAGRETDANARIDLYLQALDICSDCKAAADMLRQTPPSAPREVKATVTGQSVKIEWTALQTKYVEYQIVRKAKSMPNSPSDGETISVTRDHILTDPQPTEGESYYYAVFSKCGNVTSATSAKTQSPVLLAVDLKPADIATDIQTRQIGFNIRFPKNAAGVEVYRDGKLVSTMVGSSFIDTGLTPDRQYAYRFVVVYADCTGKKWRSEGYQRTFAPTSPPEAVKITLTEGEKTATISWKNPARGTLVIYQSDTPFSLLPGNKVSIDSLRYHKLDIIGERTQIAKNFSGARYYLPVTISGGTGIVGEAVKLVSIACPQNIKIDQGDGYFTARWDWAGARAVRIITTLGTGGAQTTDIRHPAKPEARIDIPKGNKSVTVRIMSMISIEGQTMTAVAHEQTLTLEALRLNFVDAKSPSSLFGLFGKSKYTLTLRAESPLPCDIDVLVGERVPPIDIKTRAPQATIKASQCRPGSNVEFEIDYSRRDKNAPLYIRLVPSDHSKMGLIAIIPDMKKL